MPVIVHLISSHSPIPYPCRAYIIHKYIDLLHHREYELQPAALVRKIRAADWLPNPVYGYRLIEFVSTKHSSMFQR